MNVFERLWIIITRWFCFSEPGRMQGIIPDPNPKPRKTMDTVKITQYQYDWIVEQGKLRIEFNKTKTRPDKISFDKLTVNLNERFGLNKCHTVYRKICKGQTKREDLVTGTPLEQVDL